MPGPEPLATVGLVGLPTRSTRGRLPGSGQVWSFVAAHVVPLLFAGLVVATYLEPSLAGDADNPALRPIDGWWLLAGLIAANALAFRKWSPLASMAVVTVMVTFVGVAPYSLSPIAWMVYVGAFALGRYAPARHGTYGLAWFSGSVAVTWFSNQDLTGVDVAFVFAFGAMSWLAGRELGRWRHRAESEMVEADRRIELERQALELAVTQQRLHIAQELHDVVAHSLGVIAVQAGMADAAFDARPDEARRAVENIAQTSRVSLTEIRRILGVLREDGDGRSVGGAAPRLGDLGSLISGVEANGLTIDSNLTPPPDLPQSLELSAYRIVQQALTNVLEHAQATAVTVSVTGRDQVLDIDVVDDGRGQPPDADHRNRHRGYGLVGMQERVATYGGRLDAGPRPGGGFRVHAIIPYGELTGRSLPA